jgi:hypothetical protein
MRPRDQVVEFRNYLMRPGQRDALIELFEREFIEPQERLGAHVLGVFENLHDKDRFVWVRGFADFDARLRALEGFYGGEIWKAHRASANATMANSDDVLLLRPIGEGLDRQGAAPAPLRASAPMANAGSIIVATTYFLEPHGEEPFAGFFERDVAPVLSRAGGEPIATFATERSANNFPQLPVRENETVFLTLARFLSRAAHDDHLALIRASPEWRALEPALRGQMVAPTQTLRLRPTPRSLLR